ncbi:type II toxin-antitoxin system Phd/YefM family antitoxin [Sphaerotilus mobilis]|uniref:Antitoxin n=1 Tax=Sphaerotilus mobilis TaxID=47994 RepID=A0A4Q7LWG9_9BURK|nr:type II toxin-antitoxin system Phd/YefM family antitoxin [Sphaerotilus mobilis]RZS58109.1 antitoxin StbD [Sphaerotilus mobilis]
MSRAIMASSTASISDFRRNPSAILAAGEGCPVAILRRNVPVFYCVPAPAYDALMDRLENFELDELASTRLAAGEVPEAVDLQNL